MSGETTAGDGLGYIFKPSLLGAPWEFKLTAEGIEWIAGHKSGRVPYRAIRRVRMMYRPASMQSYRFVTEVWSDNSPKLQLVSTSWKSLLDQERLDQPYTAFIRELHARMAQAGATARFEHGSNPLIYWPGFVVFGGMGIAMLVLILRTLMAGALSASGFVSLFFLLFVWQSGNFFRRNRPGVYSPDALPQVLLPWRPKE